MDDLNNDQVEFLPENPRVSKYVLFAAKRDFTRGVKNYLMTDDSLRERRPNKFSIYLEPGQYRLKTGVTNTYNVGLTVSRNVNENAFIIETLQQGMALYAIPDVQIFEAEMKKALVSADELREDEAAAEDLGLDTGSDLANEADSLDIDDLPLRITWRIYDHRLRQH
ncbi:MAG: hypothetical protein M5R36_02255 [Deltaproteobacteria bacterium]|nr:hypothetical protein [Deltaproteobacteria bacterium]